MEFLLSTILSCSDGKWILDGLAQSDLSAAVRTDMVITVIQSMPDNCKESDYRGESTR